MKINPVGCFEIYVKDISRAKAFYQTVFQVELTRMNSPDLELWGFPISLDAWGGTWGTGQNGRCFVRQ